ncbi:MAG: hypothetical protein K9M15_00675, partial [Candidatus Marinimicrobia bacterium]|nr:hypothetical protein [Candidatus Neomarinimicrobiota bacterium]
MKTIKTILEEETRQKVVWNDNFGVYALNLDSKEDALKIADSEKIKENFDIEIVEAGKRAFLNFSPKENVLTNVLTNILTKDRFEFLSNKIQVEFVSANPTGLLTLGNGRGGVYGDVLGNILEKAGAKVTKEYYINDAGNQINELGRSVLGDEEGQYKGEYIDELAKEIKGSSPKEVGQKAQEKI